MLQIIIVIIKENTMLVFFILIPRLIITEKQEVKTTNLFILKKANIVYFKLIPANSHALCRSLKSVD